jgi:hypothetical protein
MYPYWLNRFSFEKLTLEITKLFSYFPFSFSFFFWKLQLWNFFETNVFSPSVFPFFLKQHSMNLFIDVVCVVDIVEDGNRDI